MRKIIVLAGVLGATVFLSSQRMKAGQETPTPPPVPPIEVASEAIAPRIATVRRLFQDEQIFVGDPKNPGHVQSVVELVANGTLPANVEVVAVGQPLAAVQVANLPNVDAPCSSAPCSSESGSSATCESSCDETCQATECPVLRAAKAAQLAAQQGESETGFAWRIVLGPNNEAQPTTVGVARNWRPQTTDLGVQFGWSIEPPRCESAATESCQSCPSQQTAAQVIANQATPCEGSACQTPQAVVATESGRFQTFIIENRPSTEVVTGVLLPSVPNRESVCPGTCPSGDTAAGCPGCADQTCPTTDVADAPKCPSCPSCPSTTSTITLTAEACCPCDDSECGGECPFTQQAMPVLPTPYGVAIQTPLPPQVWNGPAANRTATNAYPAVPQIATNLSVTPAPTYPQQTWSTPNFPPQPCIVADNSAPHWQPVAPRFDAMHVRPSVSTEHRMTELMVEHARMEAESRARAEMFEYVLEMQKEHYEELYGARLEAVALEARVAHFEEMQEVYHEFADMLVQNARLQAAIELQEEVVSANHRISPAANQRIEQLTTRLHQSSAENSQLRARLAELEAKIEAIAERSESSSEAPTRR